VEVKRKKEEVNKKEKKEEEEETQDEVVKPALGEVTHVPFNWPILSDEVLIQRSRQFYEVIFSFSLFWSFFAFKEQPSLIQRASSLKTIA
jgi:hypothetical protein